MIFVIGVSWNGNNLVYISIAVVVDDEGGKVKRGEISRFEIKVTHEATLNEILHKINSIEIKLCSDGVKEFIKLLKLIQKVKCFIYMYALLLSAWSF